MKETKILVQQITLTVLEKNNELNLTYKLCTH